MFEKFRKVLRKVLAPEPVCVSGACYQFTPFGYSAIFRDGGVDSVMVVATGPGAVAVGGDSVAPIVTKVTGGDVR